MHLSPKKILIVRLGAIGDVIRTLPALNSLRRKFPENYIAWIVEEKSQSILAGHPQIDELIILKRDKWQKQILDINTFFATIKEVLFFLRDLRKKRFDLVFDFHGIIKSGIIGLLSGARERVGFRGKFTREFNFLFNNHRISLPEGRLNRVERNLRLLSYLGVDEDARDAIFPLFPEDRAAIDTFFQRYVNLRGKPLVAIHPGSSTKTGFKRWDSFKYARLADKLIECYRATLILTWSGEEIEIVKDIKSMMKNDPIIACATSTLRELAELIKRCDLYIGGDTAPMHIATFNNIPVLAIFGPTDPVENAPYGKNRHIIIRRDLPCSPCRNRKCPTRECTEVISCDEVFQAAEELLK